MRFNFKDYDESLGKMIKENSDELHELTRLGFDIVSAVEPVFAIVGSSIRYVQGRNLYYFLKGISKDLNVEKIRNLLYQYNSNPEKAACIAQILHKAISSSSKKANVAIGMNSAQFLEKDTIPTQLELAVIDTLFDMNDYDVENYIRVYEFIVKQGNSFVHKGELVKLIINCEAGIELTINKLSSHQAFEVDIFDYRAEEACMTLGSDKYRVTQFGTMIYDALKKAGPVLEYK